MLAVEQSGSAAEAARILWLLRGGASSHLDIELNQVPARAQAADSSAEAERWDLLEGIAERLRHPQRRDDVCLRLLEQLAASQPGLPSST